MNSILIKMEINQNKQEGQRKPKIFENSRGYKSSSIVLEYLFFLILSLLIVYSVLTGRDIPTNTMTLLKWIGIALTCGVEGYKINDRICDACRRENR